MAQVEEQLGIFFFFLLSHQLLVLFGGQLADEDFNDGLHGFARRSVNQNNGGHVFAEWFCNAGDQNCVRTHTLMLA